MSVGTGVRLLSGVQQLVPDHMLGPGELFAANITRVLVMVLGAVGLHVLGQFAHLAKLFATLTAREAPDLSALTEPRTRGSVSILLLDSSVLSCAPQPTLRPRRHCQGLEAIITGQTWRRYGPIPPDDISLGLLWLQHHLYVVDSLHVGLQLFPLTELVTTLGTVPVPVRLLLDDILVAGVAIDHLDQPGHGPPDHVVQGEVGGGHHLLVMARHVLLEVARVFERSVALVTNVRLARIPVVNSVR